MIDLIKGYKFKLIFSTVLIIVVYSLFTNFPYALNNTGDEFSYLTMAANFSGIDWSQLTSTWCYYYSFGYSLLIAPLFFIFNNIDLVYLCCVILNIIFIVGSFWISIKCFKKLFPKLNENLLLLFCLTISLYSSNIVNTKWAWGECALVFLYWLILNFLVNYTNDYKKKNLLVIGILSIFGYSIHQRFLVIIIALIIYLGFLLFLKKIKIKDLILLLVIVVLGYFLTNFLKNEFFVDFFSKKNIDANNINGVINNLTNIDWTNIKNLIRGGIGKLYYLVVSSFYLVPFSFVFGLKNIKYLIQKKEKIDTRTLIVMFILIILIGAYLLNTIFMTGGGYSRHDCIIYGRYMEYVYGPVLLVGFIEIINNSHRFKWLGTFFLMGLICAFFVSKSWTFEAITYSKSMSTSSIVNYYFYPDKINLNMIPYIALFIRTILVGIVFLLIKKNIKCGIIMLAIVALICWSYNGIRYNQSAYNYINGEYTRFKKMDDLMSAYPNENIYIVYDEKLYSNPFDNIANIERLQVMLWDKPIQVIENNINKKGIYIVVNSQDSENLIKKYKLINVIYEDYDWIIFEK